MIDSRRPTAPTNDQLRHDIDSGRTGEKKIEWPDPAAVPLGADAEAGGVATPADARQGEADTMPSTGTPDTPSRTGLGGFAAYLVVALVVLAVVLVVVSFT